VRVAARDNREIVLPPEPGGGPVVGLEDAAGVEPLDSVDLPGVFGLRMKRRRA